MNYHRVYTCKGCGQTVQTGSTHLCPKNTVPKILEEVLPTLNNLDKIMYDEPIYTQRELDAAVEKALGKKIADGWVDSVVAETINEIGWTGYTIWTDKVDGATDLVPVSIYHRKVTK